GKLYLLVNLRFSVFILQFAINTEAGQPQTPKVVQFPSTQTFSSAQAVPPKNAVTRYGPQKPADLDVYILARFPDGLRPTMGFPPNALHCLIQREKNSDIRVRKR
ncbi:hypothetical protein, partial [Rubripirellula obstinata]